MRAHELTEYESGTDNSAAIFAKLKKLGYERLGGGQDATVWSKNEASVIKILMPTDKPHQAENGFLTFYNFCQANPSVNLPKFISIGGAHHSVFEINGTPYRQIAMERLSPIPSGSFEEAIVWLFADMVSNSRYNNWGSISDTMLSPASWGGLDSDISERMPNVILGRMRNDSSFNDNYFDLFKTMRQLYITGKRSHLGWDCHTENVMQRKDGTLVIVDPFYS